MTIYKKFQVEVKPSNLLKTMRKHQGDVSEGDKVNILAVREILGYQIVFFKSGEHYIEGISELTEEEQFNSEIFRLAHASLLTNQPEGDKRILWVDATKNPVEVWVYNMPAEKFIKQAKKVIQNGEMSLEFAHDGDPVQEIRNKNNDKTIRLP